MFIDSAVGLSLVACSYSDTRLDLELDCILIRHGSAYSSRWVTTLIAGPLLPSVRLRCARLS